MKGSVGLKLAKGASLVHSLDSLDASNSLGTPVPSPRSTVSFNTQSYTKSEVCSLQQNLARWVFCEHVSATWLGPSTLFV